MHRYLTGDTTYNDEVAQALLWQAGASYDFMPQNQTMDEGNDDQGFWGMAVMAAAESNFQNPPAGTPGWVAMAQAVFNEMAGRWDTTYCGGGLRWQIYSWNQGYTYKNSIANGCLFNIGARLARYTGNQTYAAWAEKVWDWEVAIGLISDTYDVYDGSSLTENCTSVDHLQFTYNQGIYLLGAAMMYNIVRSASPCFFTAAHLLTFMIQTNGATQQMWQTRVQGLLNASSVFFKDNIMYEVACEDVNGSGTCDVDQLSFKAYFSRWLAATTQLAPFTRDQIMAWLQPSAVAAAAQCDGAANGVTCGEHWTANSTWDGTWGVGQQMSALSVIQNQMIFDVVAPPLLTNTTGGTSQGNPAAGTGQQATVEPGIVGAPVTTAAKAGAGILTALVLCGFMGSVGFMVAGG